MNPLPSTSDAFACDTEHFVSGVGLAHLYYGAQRLGLPVEDVLRRARLDPGSALQPMARVPTAQLETFVQELLLVSQDELLGMHIGQQMMPAIFNTLTSLAFSATSLREALHFTTKYQALIGGNSGGFHVEERPNGNMLLTASMVTRHPVLRRHLMTNLMLLGTAMVRFMLLTASMVTRHPVLRRHLMTNLMLLGTAMVRFITGQPALAPLNMMLEHPAINDEERETFEALTGCPVIFSAGSNQVELDSHTLD